MSSSFARPLISLLVCIYGEGEAEKSNMLLHEMSTECGDISFPFDFPLLLLPALFFFLHHNIDNVISHNREYFVWDCFFFGIWGLVSIGCERWEDLVPHIYTINHLVIILYSLSIIHERKCTSSSLA